MSPALPRRLIATEPSFLGTGVTTAAKDKDTTSSRLVATVMTAIPVPDRVQCDTVPSSSNRVDGLLVCS